MRLIYLSVGFIFLLGGLACAQTSSLEKIDSILNELNSEGIFSGNVLIGEKGKIIYEKSFGEFGRETLSPLSPETIFPVGSVSKTITAVAVMKLAEQGRLSLSDPLTKYLPELPFQNITVRQMLSHTSGLPEYQTEAVLKEIGEKGITNAELAAVFARLKLKEDFAPGSRWQYSNTNYIFLALIVEKASGQSYPQFLKKNIFKPARMLNTFILRNSIPETLKNRVAAGFRIKSFVAEKQSNIETLAGAVSYYATVGRLFGAGGIYSTARDLFRFHEALVGGRILKKETLAEMYIPAHPAGGEAFAAQKNTNYPAGYGLGWFVADDQTGGRIIYHPGGVVGYVSYFLRNITKNQCIVVLSNNENLKHYTPTALLRILNGQPFQLDKKSLAAALGREYVRNGPAAVQKLFVRLKDDPDYIQRAAEMDALGYQLFVEKNDAPAALEILKINAEKFPSSFEVWDSLGEIYYKSGNLAEAAKNYEKSLQLNPQNKDGQQTLEKIKSEIAGRER